MALGLAIAKDLSDEAELNEICVDSITEKHFSPKQNFKRTKIPEVQENDSKKLERCIELFESFCIVSESVRQGIPINVKIIR